MKTKIPPPVLAILFAAIIWAVDKHLAGGEVAVSFRVPMTALLGASAIALVASANMAFRKAKTTVNPMDPSKASTLVSTGVFTMSRNPMYLAVALLLSAWAVWLGNVFNLASIIGFVWYMTNFQIKAEEEALAKIFGEAYEAYCKKVRRWI